MNEEDIKKFYEFLGHEKETELRFFGKDKEIRQIWVSSFESFLKNIKTHNGVKNLYVGLNERTIHGDKDEHVKNITIIGHDIDAHSGNIEDYLKAQTAAIQIQKDCIDKGMEKPLLLCSGRGFWIIHKVPPIENNELNVRKIKAFGKWVKEKYEVEGIDLDSSVYNPSRIARIPGTINMNHPDKVVSFIAGTYSLNPDEILKSKILDIDIQTTLPPTNIKSHNNVNWCAFMDYCLTHEIPKGERHKVISRNMAWYISDHPDRELLKEQYTKIQKGSEGELDGWLKNIDDNGKEKYPFSHGELINFQRKYKIPLKCRNCPKFVEYRKEKKAEKKLQEAVKIENNPNYSDLQKEVLISMQVKDFASASEFLVQAFLKENYVYTTKDDVKSEMWVYEDGIYVPNGKSNVKEFCRKVLQQTYNQFISNLVVSKIETDTAISQDDFFKNLYVELLPVENGILNVRTRELSPFDPTKIFFNKLPVEYDDEAICPSIDKFLRDILSNEEDVSVAYEIIGSGLLKDYFTEKAAMLVGGGRNGKSKFLELIRRIAGIRNTSSVPIRAMKEDNSSLCELHGKLFNLAGDLSGGDLKFTGVFKETVGRDTLQAHRKFLRDLIFVNYAKHIFACNELPRVFDTTDGFWDKWILLEFPYKFITKEERATLSDEDKVGKKIKDPEIIEKITSPEELSGLLNEALDGLDRLFKMKGFSQTIGTKEIKDFWIRKSDSFTAFCIDNLEDDVDGYVTKKGIRKRFSQYCRNHNIKGAGDKDIKITLENRFGATEGSKVIDYTQERVWEGIKFKNLHMK